MRNISKKTIGFVLILAAAILELIGLIRFCSWAPQHNAYNLSIVLALVAGLIITAILYWKDFDLLVVILSACYTYAAMRLLMDSVGSFVDKYQNIVMFGDSTQVPTIVTTATIMGVGLLLVLIAAFMRREKTKG